MDLNRLLGMFSGGGIMQMVRDKVSNISRGMGNAGPVNTGTGMQGGNPSPGTLESRVGELMLVVNTLAELLVSKGVITEQEFQDKLREFDMRDGKQDGKMG